MGRLIVNVPVKDVECDEIWAFVQKKERRKRGAQANDDSVGDAYCYVGIERHSKLVLNFALDDRSLNNCATLGGCVGRLVKPRTGWQPVQIRAGRSSSSGRTSHTASCFRTKAAIAHGSSSHPALDLPTNSLKVTLAGPNCSIIGDARNETASSTSRIRSRSRLGALDLLRRKSSQGLCP